LDLGMGGLLVSQADNNMNVMIVMTPRVRRMVSSANDQAQPVVVSISKKSLAGIGAPEVAASQFHASRSR